MLRGTSAALNNFSHVTKVAVVGQLYKQGSVYLRDASRSLQLSLLAAEATGPWQSPTLSDQVSNDLLEAVQQPKPISQGNKGTPTAWSGPECSHSLRGRTQSTGQAFHGQRKGSVTKPCSVKTLICQGR